MGKRPGAQTVGDPIPGLPSPLVPSPAAAVVRPPEPWPSVLLGSQAKRTVTTRMASDDQALRQVLQSVCDAGSGWPLNELGWIPAVRRQGNRAILTFALPHFAAAQRDRLAAEARTALTSLPDIDDVQIEVAQPASSGPIGGAGHGPSHGPERQPIPGVAKVIAVSSGKGGVGKSTVAVNLACALAQSGLRVGLLDADIYGPNAPTMLGVAGRTPEVQGEGADQCLTPIATCGLVMVSMGLLIADDQPVIWRGPMLNGIIRQFLLFNQIAKYWFFEADI